jgi:gas vesicle protein
MRRERETPRVVVIERGSSSGAFLWGALLGAGFALLVAPRTGAETRRLLRMKSRDLLDAAGDKADELRQFVSDGYERTRERVEESLETARRAVDERRDTARDVVDAGRAAVHSARQELERRLTEARSARAHVPQRDDGEEESE